MGDVNIDYAGGNEVMRFNDLQKMYRDISQRMLSVTLRTLEADGLIGRKAYPEIPPRVEYSLTPRGLSLFLIWKAWSVGRWLICRRL